jgi:hypothetical protein
LPDLSLICPRFIASQALPEGNVFIAQGERYFLRHERGQIPHGFEQAGSQRTEICLQVKYGKVELLKRESVVLGKL